MATLASGDSIQLLDGSTMHFSSGPSALRLRYQTSKSISDLPGLRKQAQEVWDNLRPQVEQEGFRNAVLSANDAPKGFILTTNSSYNFVFDRRPDGSWHCSFDDPGQAAK
jgi:hypothetical protein